MNKVVFLLLSALLSQVLAEEAQAAPAPSSGKIRDQNGNEIDPLELFLSKFAVRASEHSGEPSVAAVATVTSLPTVPKGFLEYASYDASPDCSGERVQTLQVALGVCNYNGYELRPATLNVAPFSVTEVENKGSHYSVKVTGFNDASCTRRNSTTTFSQSTQCNGASRSRINLYKSRPKHELGVIRK
jgi:hypothetical protein